MDKLYTIGDAAAELGMPASTIRFYEKNGLIPNQQRSSDGRRLFDEDDLEWMRFVERLKVSGMPIKEIRDYIKLDDDHAIFEVTVPDGWIGRTIGNIDIRKKYGINILAIRINGQMTLQITPDSELNGDMTLLVFGDRKAIQKCFRI